VNKTPIDPLAVRINKLEQTVETLIAWISQSANSPLSRREVELLLEMLR